MVLYLNLIYTAFNALWWTTNILQLCLLFPINNQNDSLMNSLKIKEIIKTNCYVWTHPGILILCLLLFMPSVPFYHTRATRPPSFAQIKENRNLVIICPLLVCKRYKNLMAQFIVWHSQSSPNSTQNFLTNCNLKVSPFLCIVSTFAKHIQHGRPLKLLIELKIIFNYVFLFTIHIKHFTSKCAWNKGNNKTRHCILTYPCIPILCHLLFMSSVPFYHTRATHPTSLAQNKENRTLVLAAALKLFISCIPF